MEFPDGWDRGRRSRMGTPRLMISPDALTAFSTLGNPQTATVVGRTGANRTVAEYDDDDDAELKPRL